MLKSFSYKALWPFLWMAGGAAIAIACNYIKISDEDKFRYYGRNARNEDPDVRMKAYRMLHAAASSGHVYAQAEWGWVLDQGLYNGINDYHSAYTWWLRAALAGDPSAQIYLIRYYEIGAAGPKDLVLAHAWKIILNNNQKNPSKGLEISTRFPPMLTKEQLAEAEARAAKIELCISRQKPEYLN
jgi:hypothetical protein